ncbi:MAG: sigma-70 family RNA polymerase sigma factor [Anaerolineae bacterium]|nr:sigma-70 family RNA polymerase sigma factor [Anaerolineae bacterium]
MDARTAQQEEQAWIAQARQGDLAAFAHLVQAYQRLVYNLTYRMLGNAQDAEDAAQETFLRAFQHLHTYDPRRKFANWILSIASHHCVDRLRRRRKRWASLDEMSEQGHSVPSRGESLEEAAMASEAAEEVQRLLERMPPRDRLALILFYWYEMSHREIAEVTGSSVSAVKSRLHRARLALARMLREGRAAGERAPTGGRTVRPRPREVEGR